MKALDYGKLDAILGLEYNGEEIDTFEALEKQVINAIPIPNNATNGDMIKALFPDCEFSNARPFTDDRWETVNFQTDNRDKPTVLRTYDKWWNAPYK